MSPPADSMYETVKRRALLATHIDPAWEGPSRFQGNVERYLAEEDYDDFICISSRSYDSGDFDERADRVLYSPDGDLYEDEVAELLDSYDSFLHIGAYWGLCHGNTFQALADSIADREGDTYTVDIPLDGVTTRESLISDVVVPRDGFFTRLYRDVREVVAGPQVVEQDMGDMALHEVFGILDGSEVSGRHNRYLDILDERFSWEEVDIGFDQMDGMRISYTLTPGRMAVEEGADDRV